MITVARKSAKLFASHSRFVIGVSLHNPSCAGESFSQIIEWINEQDNFTGGIIDLADSLNRHNYMLADSISEDEALIKARRFGDVWLKRHSPIIDRLNVPVAIVRWDRWLRHPKFSATQAVFKDLFQTNKLFRGAVLEDVSGFYARQGRLPHQLLPKEISASANYLLEEITAHSLMYENMQGADIYPGKELKCYELVRAGKIDGAPMGIQNSCFTRLVFRDERQIHVQPERKAA